MRSSDDGSPAVLFPRMVAAARRYAAFQQSDPFAFARAMAHIEQGICGYTDDGKEGWYDAEQHSTYGVGGVVTTHFTNVSRP